MEVRRLYLDANVLIALGEGKGEVAELLTELAGQQEVADTPFLCTSELTLSEVLVQPQREQNDVLIDRYDAWLTTATFMEVGSVDRWVLWYAAVVRARYKAIKLPDAIHLSTAIGFECSHILTADAKIPALVKLTHTRYGITKGPVQLVTLRPNPETLRQIIQGQKQL